MSRASARRSGNFLIRAAPANAALTGDKAYLEGVMKSGAEQASYYARKTLSKVRRKIGFVN